MTAETRGRWVSWVIELTASHSEVLLSAWSDRKRGKAHAEILLGKAVATANRFDRAENLSNEVIATILRSELDCCWKLAHAKFRGKGSLEAILAMEAVDRIVKPQSQDGELTPAECSKCLEVFAGFDEKLIKQYAK